MPKLIDLTGQRFGRLVVLGRDENSKSKLIRWKCICDCGNTKSVQGSNLKSGDIQSCGCLHKEKLATMSKIINSKHNMCGTRLHGIWKSMRQRCLNIKSKKYKDYGQRGIKVYKGWDDFIKFYDWAMANGYEENLIIDRIDVNGNYEPSNCRWATSKQQVNNTRVNHLLTYKGETHTISEWSDIVGIKADTIQKRVNKYGWTIEKALTQTVNN